MNCADLIDRQRYPVDEPKNPIRDSVIEQVRTQLANDGCAVLRNFFSPDGVQALLAEALDRAGQAYFAPKKECNVYLGDANTDHEDTHPQNVFLRRDNGFVTADLYSAQTLSRQLYYWSPLKDFLAECLGKQELFIYEDPISNMIVNVGKPGQQFNWHFDTNEFTITMLLRGASSGGQFEYVPNLRSATNECYGEVQKVLEGDRQRIRRLDLNAGDLQFFLGRYSLHRVTPNTGNHDRLLLIMSFAEQPGMVGSEYRVKDLYGKVTEVHRQRKRSDDLLD
ncbi:MAG: hypothetical protein AB8B86_08595 [Pseudomonadales bacterium]